MENTSDWLFVHRLNPFRLQLCPIQHVGQCFRRQHFNVVLIFQNNPKRGLNRRAAQRSRARRRQPAADACPQLIVEHAFGRALELAEQVGERAERMQTLWGLGTYHQGRGDLHRSLELATRFQELAESGGRGGERAEAAYFVGANLFFLGRFPAARERLDVACDPALRQDAGSAVAGQDSLATSLMYSALVDWQLGFPDRSRERCRQALERAEEVGQPFTLAGCRAFASWIHQFRGEPEAAARHAEEALAMAESHGFPFWEAWSTMALGWARVVLGSEGAAGGHEPETDALASLEQGLTDFRAGGMRLLETYFLSTLAEAQSRLGQTSQGLTTLEQALQAVEESDERFWQAELHRLRRIGGVDGDQRFGQVGHEDVVPSRCHAPRVGEAAQRADAREGMRRRGGVVAIDAESVRVQRDELNAADLPPASSQPDSAPVRHPIPAGRRPDGARGGLRRRGSLRGVSPGPVPPPTTGTTTRCRRGCAAWGASSTRCLRRC